MADQLALDTATLAVATFLDIFLVSAPFTPGPDLVNTDLTIVTAAGLAAKTTTSAVMITSRDPQNGDYLIDIPPPVGGFIFVAGGAGLPLDIYGFGLVDAVDPTKLYAAELFDDPITINAAGQSIDLGGSVQLRIPSGVIT